MEFEYLPIEKEGIKYRPDEFLVEINNVLMSFVISWNVDDKSFYFDLFQRDGTPIVYGRRIVYGQDMLENTHDDYIPNNTHIIPEDLSGEYREISYENFMDNIKTYIFTGSDS